MAKVFLSAGHGGSDPGAVAYGLKEKDINLNTLLACNEVLIRHGVTTVLSRTKDENDPVGQEVKEANASGADLAVSFHANAGGGDGFEAYYYTTNAKAKKLAQLGEKYVKQLGQNSRGLKPGNHLYFVKNTKMTAVLFESFFVDNDKDNDIGDTVAEQRAFGVAYAKAILEYLGISYNDSQTPQTDASDKMYRVYEQIGAFKSKENAEKLQKERKAQGKNVIIM
ncbi:N-acetylmuramoyl-L-alanine amidase [Faecalicatena contorta]|uniref:N-acetylmuramoyl-L-alanine amidase n=1 Tax=Faecalicatena contorta TaxID=39482 RepID=UPI001F18F3EC|nr:N-acetylmuramoyl-L-alanine amidase [Faecalicatena contorta]MCF2555736.1 N-acetylmuramoyl-L-alanine amidase [Faecalicatena contorta]